VHEADRVDVVQKLHLSLYIYSQDRHDGTWVSAPATSREFD
jgi:hypothetical protein